MTESLRFPDPFPPSFANAWGDDVYGLWADLVLDSNSSEPAVVQRMRWIEPGSFLMGSPDAEPGRDRDEGPQHRVTLTEGCWLADTPCIVRVWSHVLGVAGTPFAQPTLSVHGVSWLEVQQFLRTLSSGLPGCEVLLPTEAQWEYACRAGTTTAFSCGDSITLQSSNFDSRSIDTSMISGRPMRQRGPLPVKVHPPNAWGLYEMHGNVWEWCVDGLRRYTADAVVDPIGPMDDASIPRVVRGGSFVREAHDVRSATRDFNRTDLSRRDIGFRFILRPRP